MPPDCACGGGLGRIFYNVIIMDILLNPFVFRATTGFASCLFSPLFFTLSFFPSFICSGNIGVSYCTLDKLLS